MTATLRSAVYSRARGRKENRRRRGLSVAAIAVLLVVALSALPGRRAFAGDQPAMTALDLQTANEDLARKLAAAERRIRDLEAQIQRGGTAAASAMTATATSSNGADAAAGAVPPRRATQQVAPPGQAAAPGQVAQGAGLPPSDSEPSRYAPLEAMEEKLPSWFPKVLGAQWNVINQKQFPFNSPYSGPLSLNQNGEDKTSQTRAVYLGSQLTDNLQFYFDVEWFVGNGIHGGNGLGGYPNGDVVRAGAANLPKDPYLARAYGRYLIPLSAETVQVARGQDQLPGHEPAEYIVIKGGHFAASDDFDTNRYANSVRTQFLNFALINNGAYDFAADTRGYSNGVVVGWVKPDWSLKFGTFQVPRQANGTPLDEQIGTDQGNQAEFAVKPFANDTVLRFLAYANQGRMGRYRTAVQVAQQTGNTPDITLDDKAGRLKYGFGLNAEVPLADGGNTGLFFRAGWNDGQTETWAFTEIDRTLSLGGQLSGARWGRDDDWLAMGTAINGLSSAHKDYIAAGGVGFMIGDGKLNYAPETILETYYSLKIDDYFRLSPDYQFILNPAYNADRGPVHIASIRARASF